MSQAAGGAWCAWGSAYRPRCPCARAGARAPPWRRRRRAARRGGPGSRRTRTAAPRRPAPARTPAASRARPAALPRSPRPRAGGAWRAAPCRPGRPRPRRRPAREPSAVHWGGGRAGGGGARLHRTTIPLLKPGTIAGARLTGHKGERVEGVGWVGSPPFAGLRQSGLIKSPRECAFTGCSSDTPPNFDSKTRPSAGAAFRCRQLLATVAREFMPGEGSV